jgi:predicted Rdx family selenoprotein
LNASGIPATALPGGKGQFDVIRDGELVFSKHETGRFPEDGEILTALRG